MEFAIAAARGDAAHGSCGRLDPVVGSALGDIAIADTQEGTVVDLYIRLARERTDREVAIDGAVRVSPGIGEDVGT